MSNNQRAFNEKVTGIARLEAKLWRLYRKSEKDSQPTLWNLIIVWRNTRTYQQAKLLPWYSNFVITILLTTLFVVLTLWKSEWFLLGYCIALLIAFKTSAQYRVAHAIHSLYTDNYAEYGFGVRHASLIASKFMNLMKSEGIFLNQKSITSITKLVKAGQDYSEITFGFFDYLKKGLYGAPVAIAYALIDNWHHVKDAHLNTEAFGWKVAILIACLIPLLISISSLLYELLFGETLMKRRKKKYLLLLNLISETLD